MNTFNHVTLKIYKLLSSTRLVSNVTVAHWENEWTGHEIDHLLITVIASHCLPLLLGECHSSLRSVTGRKSSVTQRIVSSCIRLSLHQVSRNMRVVATTLGLELSIHPCPVWVLMWIVVAVHFVTDLTMLNNVTLSALFIRLYFERSLVNQISFAYQQTVWLTQKWLFSKLLTTEQSELISTNHTVLSSVLFGNYGSKMRCWISNRTLVKQAK